MDSSEEVMDKEVNKPLDQELKSWFEEPAANVTEDLECWNDTDIFGREEPSEDLASNAGVPSKRTYRLHIANIHAKLTKEGLKSMLGKFGKPNDYFMNQHRGYAFVSFDNLSSAEQAIAGLNHKPPYNLAVYFARTKTKDESKKKAERKERSGRAETIHQLDFMHCSVHVAKPAKNFETQWKSTLAECDEIPVHEAVAAQRKKKLNSLVAERLSKIIVEDENQEPGCLEQVTRANFTAFVTQVDFPHFFVVPRSSISTLKNITRAMEEHFEPGPVAPYAPDDKIMVAVWDDDNCCWLRAIVREVHKSKGTYQLFCIDFGDCLEATPENIRKLPERIEKEPRCAYQCLFYTDKSDNLLNEDAKDVLDLLFHKIVRIEVVKVGFPKLLVRVAFKQENINDVVISSDATDTNGKTSEKM